MDGVEIVKGEGQFWGKCGASIVASGEFVRSCAKMCYLLW